MTAEKTAQGAADQGRAAFRLSQPTPLREKPQMSSRVLETLAAGSVVTVQSDAGSFLSVITAADILGYIADDTPVTLAHGASEASVSAADEAERSRSREALIFMNRLDEEAERAKQEPVASPSIVGVAAAAVGLAGLLLVHAFSGMANTDLMVFFGLDVLLPLAVLTANPNAPIAVYGLVIAVYLALVTGYVAI